MGDIRSSGEINMEGLSVEALEHVAAHFRALSEPTRLRILSLLHGGERSVGELAQLCEYTSANISRHLSILSKHGIVKSTSRGTSVYYYIADDSVYSLCDVVCGSIARQLERATRESQAFAQSVTRAPGQDK